MALRDQPYLPLYIKDFLSDEKLIECSAESTGVYIRIMCLMHQSAVYGKISLDDKYNISADKVNNFAHKLSKYLPYPIQIIKRSLTELLHEGVLYIEDETLCQRRMIKDGAISTIRSDSRRQAHKLENKLVDQDDFANDVFAEHFVPTKSITKIEQNTEDEIVYEIGIEDEIVENNRGVGKEGEKEKKEGKKRMAIFVPPTVEDVTEYCLGRKNSVDAESFINFYTSKGWMIGKNKMIDWRAAVRTWEKSARNDSGKGMSVQEKQEKIKNRILNNAK